MVHRGHSGKIEKKNCPVHLGLVSAVMGKLNSNEKGNDDVEVAERRGQKISVLKVSREGKS